MRTVAIMMGGVCALLSSLVFVGSGSPARAADLPAYFKEIVGTQTASPAEIGTKNILQLNTTMFELYDDAGQIFRRTSWRSTRSSSGCSREPADDSSSIAREWRRSTRRQVPIVYQLIKSVGHSTMALAEVVVPYLNSPNDLTWRGSLAAYRNRMQSALDGLDATAMQDDWRPNQPQPSCRTTSRSWTSA